MSFKLGVSEKLPQGQERGNDKSRVIPNPSHPAQNGLKDNYVKLAKSFIDFRLQPFFLAVYIFGTFYLLPHIRGMW